jgi:hypothetical protein
MSMQFSGQEDAIDHGTLLWIGDRDSIPFRDAYDFCEACVSQLAYRSDLDAAIDRPASSVRTILCCRENDSTETIERFQRVCGLYRDAKAILLLGPLCAGARPSAGELFDAPAFHWHQWESFLPAYLRRCGWANRPVWRPQSIAIVAASHSNASALLTIASSGQASAVWCRPEQLGSLHHFDEIWWDDSATIGHSWADLLGRLSDPPPRSVWISNHVTPGEKKSALAAGIELVIVKPGDFSLLIGRVAAADSLQGRQAA